MTQTIEEKNKAFVLEAFETLFNKRDYAAAERFWSPNYIQHSAHIPPGREGLFALIKGPLKFCATRTGLPLPMATMCSSTAGLAAWAGRRTGSWWISCASRTADLPSTGTSSRTKRQRKRPLAACPCSGRHFPRDDLVRASEMGQHISEDFLTAEIDDVAGLIRSIADRVSFPVPSVHRCKQTGALDKPRLIIAGHVMPLLSHA